MEDNEKKILINVEDDETRIAVVDNATNINIKDVSPLRQNLFREFY